jgi:hypothetical protein
VGKLGLKNAGESGAWIHNPSAISDTICWYLRAKVIHLGRKGLSRRKKAHQERSSIPTSPAIDEIGVDGRARDTLVAIDLSDCV